MAIDPITGIQIGTQILGGLGGIFGSKKSRAQRRSEAAYRETAARKKKLLDEVNAMDPMSEVNAGVDMASQVLGRQLDLSNQRLIGRYAKSGGVPGGDTAFAVNRQRAIDSVSAPTAMAIANMRANAKRNNLMMRIQALGALGPDSTPIPQDGGGTDYGAYDMLAGGLDQLGSVLGRKKAETQLSKGVRSARWR